MQIVNNKALVIRTKQPERITTAIKKSAEVGKRGDVTEVAVHWGLEEAQALRQLGIKKVPSPIDRDYKWPGIFRPMAHQKETASFLTLHPRSFCFNEIRKSTRLNSSHCG